MASDDYMTVDELQDKIDTHIDANVELMRVRMKRKNIYNSSIQIIFL